MTTGRRDRRAGFSDGVPARPGASDAPRRRPYAVHVVKEGRGWAVQIVDSTNHVLFARPCQSEADARTFGSTVQQHLYWLSPGKFREYYRLLEPA